MVVTVVRVLDQRADCDEDEIVGPEIDATLHTVLDPLNPCRLFAVGSDVEIDIGDLDAVSEGDAMIFQPLNQRLVIFSPAI